jgi:hypothetical protein
MVAYTAFNGHYIYRVGVELSFQAGNQGKISSPLVVVINILISDVDSFSIHPLALQPKSGLGLLF